VQVVASLLTQATAGSEFETRHGLLVLHQDNFAQTLAQNSKLVVLFYDSACQSVHCRHIYSDFVHAANKEIRACPMFQSRGE
jgi:ABC-type Fe2+-enterobactin transport system substrate-binding protein